MELFETLDYRVEKETIMALEKFYNCSTTIARLRSAPLGKLVDYFCLWLQKLEYHRYTILRHLGNVLCLNDYLGVTYHDFKESITSKEVEAFFEAYPSLCQTKGSIDKHARYIGSINLFISYLQQSGRFEQLLPIETPIYQHLLDEYLAWLHSCRNVAAGTLMYRRHGLIIFLRYLGSHATKEDLLKLEAVTIQGFFLEYAKNVKYAVRRQMQATLRTFLRFCLQHGYIRFPLESAVPTLRTYRLSTVPRGLSEAQAIAVLDSVDRSTSNGKRDYANGTTLMNMFF